MRLSIATVLAAAALAAGSVTASAQTPAPAAPSAQPARPPPSVKVGDPAPDFDLAYFAVTDATATPPKYENKRIKLSDYKGKQNVVIAFFPAAFSPGCTNEMKAYQTSHPNPIDYSVRIEFDGEVKICTGKVQWDGTNGKGFYQSPITFQPKHPLPECDFKNMPETLCSGAGCK